MRGSASVRLVLALTSCAVLGFGVIQAQAHHKPKHKPEPSTPGATSERPCTDWGMYGGGLDRTFSREQCDSPISRLTVATLVPVWTHKTPATVTASPTVAGGKVFVGAWDGVMRAYDAQSGDVVWSYQTEAAGGAAFGPIVSSAAVAEVAGRDLVIFGAGPILYALDAGSGAVVWSRAYNRTLPVATTPVEIESSPAVHDGVVYVGLNTHNKSVDRTDGEPGAMLALDAATGADVWRFETDPAGNGCGGIWGSPAIDVVRNRVIFGTANCSSAAEWSPYTEAVVALDADTGAFVWRYQPSTPNVRDEDFGASPNLFTNADGVDVVGIGKKDAHYYIVRAEDGAPLHDTKVAEPGNIRDGFAIGGFIGSTAVLGGNVFGGTAIGGAPYYHSIDGTTGAIRWQSAGGPVYAASAGVNDVVFNAALDGVFKAYDAATGAVLWASPLLAPGSSGPAIVGDMVFIGSGTSSSDACAKEVPGSEYCLTAFDTVLGSTGGVQAFRLAAAP